jgi:transposase
VPAWSATGRPGSCTAIEAERRAIAYLESAQARIVDLVERTYTDVNDTHLSELLAEREGISISRTALRRLLRGSGRPAPRPRAPQPP